MLGLPAVLPVIEFGVLFKVEFAVLKCLIEITIAFMSIYLTLVGKLAPIFPLFFWQYIRIKYVVSNFT